MASNLNSTAKKNTNLPPTLTREYLINYIFKIDPTIKSLKSKKKAELLTIYSQLNGSADSDYKKIIRENIDLKNKLVAEQRQVVWSRDIMVRQQSEIYNLRAQNSTLKNNKTSSTAIQKTKEQLTNIVEVIGDLAENDHLNSEASRQLNKELLKAYNLLNKHNFNIILEQALDDISDDEEDISDDEEDIIDNPFNNLH